MWLVLALILTLNLSQGYQLDSGCEDWTPQGSSDIVCCLRCKPGNREVTECGPDPKLLCEPCPNGTYVDESKKSHCSRCSECRAPMRVKEPCAANRDSVCTCAPELRCGDSKCSFCVQECGAGQQPTDNRDCEPCPPGKFNDKIHSKCVKWSSRCPNPDQQIVKAGTNISDIVCGPADQATNSSSKPSTLKPEEPKADESSMVVVVICTGLVFCTALTMSVACCVAFKSAEMDKTAPELEDDLAEGRPALEPEQCSFCFPEEEHGSSSQASLLSEDKPFELVV